MEIVCYAGGCGGGGGGGGGLSVLYIFAMILNCVDQIN